MSTENKTQSYYEKITSNELSNFVVDGLICSKYQDETYYDGTVAKKEFDCFSESSSVESDSLYWVVKNKDDPKFYVTTNSTYVEYSQTEPKVFDDFEDALCYMRMIE